MPLLIVIGGGLLACAVAGRLTGRIAPHTTAGLAGLANSLISIQSIREGLWLTGLFNGAVCAFCLYVWWHGGGGDGTRRRLRQLRRSFKAVRRTAPTSA
ncbi:hypothetical protein OIE49_29440 [Streptomyces sp. NBC_01788]|uniref:hypothetical protein n=1 Tax=Streptomyces sp. NBC_01788 TaxID=2975940 RepID=UPI002DDC8D10|nr:hypothetical protein [Streptomyces sp. NBC_01788]WSB29678.1 hypothetical protein OIE49_29440 [Streptomyces sp. NBC_01788]